jgi:uncharacterized protein YyaL (SSP411 family)
MLLAALSVHHAGITQIVVVGDGAPAESMLEVIRRRYLPAAIVVRVDHERRAQLSRLLPWTSSMSAPAGGAAAFVCRNFSCDTPANSPEELERRLQSL